MQAEFQRVGWDATFVSAIDGRSRIDIELLLRTGVLSPRNRSLRNPLSAAEIGCYLTHERVWQQILDSGQPYAIVCEDDILVRDPAINLRHLARRLPAGCDLFYLYYMNDSPGLTAPAFDAASDRRVDTVDSYEVYAAWSCGGSQCYLITASGARKVLAWCRPIRFPIDGYLARMSAAGRLGTFAIHPRAIVDARLCSTIG